MYNSVPTKFISVPTKSYFFLPGGAGAPPGPLGKYAYEDVCPPIMYIH